MTHKVCIIVPIYNVSKYIERCARSLFEQTFNDIQYVFVDDCSPDNSMAILEKVLDEYIERKKHSTIFRHLKNEGQAVTRSDGLNLSKSDYILYVDSDDYIDVKTVELMYTKAINENADIVVCDFLLDWGNVTKMFYQPFDPNNIEYTKLLLDTKAQPGLPNKLIKSSLFFNYNISFFRDIDMGEDYSTTPRLAYYALKIAKVDLPLYHYVQTNNNSYTKSFSEKSIKDVVSAINILECFFTQVPDSEVFTKSLMEGKLRKKIMMLMLSKSDYRQKIANLFLETNEIIPTVRLKIEERITIYLANKKLFKLLDVFLAVYYRLVGFSQILKGRTKK